MELTSSQAFWYIVFPTILIFIFLLFWAAFRSVRLKFLAKSLGLRYKPYGESAKKGALEYRDNNIIEGVYKNKNIKIIDINPNNAVSAGMGFIKSSFTCIYIDGQIVFPKDTSFPFNNLISPKKIKRIIDDYTEKN